MPLGEKTRSSSALGRLETQNVPSILSELGRSGNEDEEEQPGWLVREQLKQNGRRLSLSSPSHSAIDPTFSLKINESISLDCLQEMKLAFEDLEKDGFEAIDAKSFVGIVKKCLPATDAVLVQGLFKKIDFLGKGTISWSNFAAHMLQEYTEKEERVRCSKRVAFALPATITARRRADSPVVNIHHSRDGVVMTVREDGAVSCWSPQLQPLRTKRMFSEGNRKWASDFCLLAEYNKLIIATGNREIQLYELSTLEPYCQINALDTVPLKMDCSCTGPDQCCFLFGDMEGCINIISIFDVEDTLRLWNKSPKTGRMPSVAIGTAVLSPNITFVRWKVHQDWVTRAKYLPCLKAVISSSSEETSSLVIGCVLPQTNVQQELSEIQEPCYEGKTTNVQLSWTPQLRASCDQTVFAIHKGVETFDLCEKLSLLVTGGMDRLIRMWNPHSSGKPTGILKGHCAPVTYLCISAEHSQIFSVSVDNTAKIWAVQEQCCLFTAESKDSGIHGDIAACLYFAAVRSLYIVADSVAVLALKTRPQPHGIRTVSHNEPVMCCGYSKEFRKVVSCSEGSLVKVWDFDTGRQVFEFGGAHNLTAITCMTFDTKGRRLITGGKDGCLKTWNFNNGRCLKTLMSSGKNPELHDCVYLDVHNNSYMISVGKDAMIYIYPDLPEEPHHIQRQQSTWQNEVKRGHKEDVLCVAHCPPSLVATGSCNGEITVWNLISGQIHSRLVSPLPAEHHNVDGLDTSVPCMIFLKLEHFSPATAALLSPGTAGCINLWDVNGGGRLVTCFKASKRQQMITKMSKTTKGAVLYAADRIGYVYIYDMGKLTVGPQPKPLKADAFWRAHTSRITGLEVVDNDQVVLTSSVDHTVRLWGVHGQFIGTFGQSDVWNVHITSSWKHPAVPYEVLTDPLSMPDCELVKGTSSDNIDCQAEGLQLRTQRVGQI
ncbi:WD repeat-containing protein 64 [Entelurus aequoreus]|uniref:WD repeat-containing protein 64 n=1 Tax=Entelurus aequoreus TaxID=161455 RepID=UPI002B1DFD91|nr:WD repeat-containing protein 64 [Entelurus aequoreus]